MSKEITEKLSSHKWPGHAEGRVGSTDVLDPRVVAAGTTDVVQVPRPDNAALDDTAVIMPGAATGAEPITTVVDARVVRAMAGREQSATEEVTDVVAVEELAFAKRPLAKPIVQLGGGEPDVVADERTGPEPTSAAPAGSGAWLVVLAVVAVGVGIAVGLALS